MTGRCGGRPGGGLAPLLVALAITGCVETRSGSPALREPATPEEHLYLTCIGRDPLFLTTRCREARAELLGDPYPGGAAR